ncbi:hypothetical protein chiPu_0002706 [Chiloscyllium punctatum]|uniref:Uncharacterized protein n=1 Tax=Chiloscyllium punctatum TaxID=137246 RepID=A0A401S1Q3_CHIPU|nr:hypothetical protein [Chiloscyllium punctatum]
MARESGARRSRRVTSVALSPLEPLAHVNINGENFEALQKVGEQRLPGERGRNRPMKCCESMNVFYRGFDQFAFVPPMHTS